MRDEAFHVALAVAQQEAMVSLIVAKCRYTAIIIMTESIPASRLLAGKGWSRAYTPTDASGTGACDAVLISGES